MKPQNEVKNAQTGLMADQPLQRKKAGELKDNIAIETTEHVLPKKNRIL